MDHFVHWDKKAYWLSGKWLRNKPEGRLRSQRSHFLAQAFRKVSRAWTEFVRAGLTEGMSNARCPVLSYSGVNMPRFLPLKLSGIEWRCPATF
jgi:hypothetical protein